MTSFQGERPTMAQVSHSEFNTSQLMPSNTDLRDMYTQRVIPEQSNYQQMNEVSFLIDDRDKTWTDLTEIELEVTIRLEETPRTPFDDQAQRPAFFENNLLHSLFEKVELEIQGHVVRTEGNYAVRAYLETVTSCTEDMLPDKEVLEGFYSTKEGADLSVGATDGGPNSNAVKASPSIYKRQEKQVRNSPKINLIGKLKTDLTEQGKNLIPGTALRVKLTKNKHAFFTRTANADTVHPVEWKEMCLHVTRSVLQDTVDASYRSALSARKLASYPIHRKTVTNVIIPKALNISIPRFVTGTIPRRIIVGFVKNSAISGSTILNPFFYEHMSVKEMWLNYDGKEYPTKHYETDFSDAEIKVKNKRAFALARKTFMPVEGVEGKPFITFERWLAGYTLFGFDLTPDQSGVTGSFYKTVRRHGDIALELRLSAEPGETMTAVVMCEYDNQIDIRAVDGQPVFDW